MVEGFSGNHPPRKTKDAASFSAIKCPHVAARDRASLERMNMGDDGRGADRRLRRGLPTSRSMRSRAGLISAIVIGAVVVLFGCELRAGSYGLDRQTAKDATVKPVTTATMPREFRGEWCIVDRGDERSSGTTEFRRGRCPSSDGDDGDLLVDHDGFSWYESRCELVRRILGRSDYAAEFNCEGEGLTTTITYAISVNPRTGRLAMRDVGWYWSWSSENAEDENRRAWAKLDKAHDLKIERCRDGSITFSFPATSHPICQR